jgi:MoxR-like ATPase
MSSFRLGVDPFTSPVEHCAAQASVFFAWARWRRAVRLGKPPAVAAARRAAYLAAHEATQRSRDAAVWAARPMAVDVLARLRNLAAPAADVLLALCVLRDRKLRRAVRDALGVDHLRPGKHTVPADVLGEVCELPETTLREVLERLADAGMCRRVGQGSTVEASEVPLARLKFRTWLEPDSFSESMVLPPRDPAPLADLALPEGLREPLYRALERHGDYLDATERHGLQDVAEPELRLFVVVGPTGAGKETLARAIAAHAGLQFHGLPRRETAADEAAEPMSPFILTYFSIRGPSRALASAEGVGPELTLRWENALADIDHVLRITATMRSGASRIAIMGVPDRILLGPELLRRAELVLDLECGDEASQRSLWRRLVPPGVMLEGTDPGALATAATLAPGHVVSTLRRALREAASTHGADVRLSLDDLRRALPAPESSHRTGTGAPSIEVTLDHLVLARETRDKVEELVAFTELTPAEVASLDVPSLGGTGGGTVALFEGPPGTGKTACAAAIAHRLGRPLVSANLGELLGRFVGESEGNVQALFEQARARPSVLFFDEADALLSARRSDSVNTHENRLVNLVLVELERHPGPVILATNFPEALDPALARRIQFHVRFGPPDEAARHALWRLHLPTTLPGSETIDLAALAREFPLTGAQIRNVARRCALRTLTLRRPVELAALRDLASEQSRAAADRVERRVAGFRA